MNYKNKWIPKESLRLLQAEKGRILDVGGGAAPYSGAAHIVDIQPYDAERLEGNAWGRDKKRDHRHQTIDYRLGDGELRDCGIARLGGEGLLTTKCESTKIGDDALRQARGRAVGGCLPSSDYGAVSAPLRDDGQMRGGGNSKTFNLSSKGGSARGGEPGTFNYAPGWSNSDYTEVDLCGCERLPFDDNSFDLGLCSHVLEDLRDPVHVVNEVFRVCRKVMVLGPSRFLEQMKGVDHPGYAGFYHHMWMLYEKDGELIFRRKTPTINLPGCHLSCPLFKTVTVEAGSFMYLGSKALAKEEMFWSEREDVEDLKKFVNANKGRSGCFEFDAKWKRPAYVRWRVRQALFGVE